MSHSNHTAGAFDLLADVYEASHRAASWPGAMRRIGERLGAHSMLLVQIDPRRRKATFSTGVGLSAELIRGYASRLAAQDPFLQACRARFPICTAAADADLATDPAAGQHAGWNTITTHLPSLEGHHLAGAVLCDDADRLAFVRVSRRPEHGPWRSRELDTLSALSPHLRRALRVQDEITRARLESLALESTLDQLAVGLCLLDRHANVLYTNAAFDTVTRRCPAVRVRSGMLVAGDPAGTHTLRELVRTTAMATRDGQPPPPRGHLAHDNDHGHSLPVLVTRLTPIAATAGIGSPDAEVAILTCDPGEPRPLSPRLLGLAYGLTGMEARIAIAIANGESVQAAAEQHHIGLATIRTHLRGAYKKLGVSRQAELVKLLLSGPFGFSATPPAGASAVS